MKFYAMFAVEMKDQGWVQAYVQNVTGMVERRGGRYLARTSNVEKLEGEGKAPQVVVLLEWPSKEAAMEFYHSDEYRPYRDSRIKGTVGDAILVAGEDVAKLAKVPG